MPRYEYWCGTCKKEMTLIHSYKEPVSNCPECANEDNFRRLVPDVRLQTNTHKTAKIGSVVKDFIKKSKDSISAEKKKLSKRNES